MSTTELVLYLTTTVLVFVIGMLLIDRSNLKAEFKAYKEVPATDEDWDYVIARQNYEYRGVRYSIKLMELTSDERKYNSTVLYFIRGFVEGERLSEYWEIYDPTSLEVSIKKLKKQAKARIRITLDSGEHQRKALKAFNKQTL